MDLLTTPLQFAFGMLFCHSKTIISHLYNHRVTSSYGEVQRFKISAAAYSAKSNHLHEVPQNGRLFQIVIDGYDTEMSFQNNGLVCIA